MYIALGFFCPDAAGLRDLLKCGHDAPAKHAHILRSDCAIAFFHTTLVTRISR